MQTTAMHLWREWVVSGWLICDMGPYIKWHYTDETGNKLWAIEKRFTKIFVLKLISKLLYMLKKKYNFFIVQPSKLLFGAHSLSLFFKRTSIK